MRKSLLVALLVLLGPGSLWAANFVGNSPVSIELGTIGFAGRYKEDSPGPITMRVVNKGPVLDAQLTVSVADPFSRLQVVNVSKPVRLPAKSSVEVHFVAPLRTGKQFTFKILSQGTVRDTQTFLGDSVGAVEDLVVVVSDGDVEFGYLTARAPNTKIAQVKTASLPEYWEAYAGVSALVVDDVRTQDLTAAQRDALVKWIQAGGLLVVNAGRQWEYLADSFLTELLPVRPFGIRRMECLPCLERKYGGKLAVARGEELFLCESFPRPDAKILVEHQGLPVVAVRQVGLGSVAFLATGAGTAAFRAWGGCIPMWNDIFGSRKSFYPVDKTATEPAMDELLSDLTGAAVISESAVGAILGVYLAFVLGNYLFFRIIGRTEWSWLVLLVVSLLGGAAIVAAGARGKPQGVSVSEIDYAAGHADGNRFRVTSYLGIYSPSRAELNIDFKDPSDIARPVVRPSASAASVGSVELGDRCELRSFLVSGRSLELIRTDSVHSEDMTLVSSLTCGAEGIVGELENRSDTPLEDCFLLFNRLAAPVGNIPARGKLPVSVDGRRGGRGYTSRMVQFDQSRARMLTNLLDKTAAPYRYSPMDPYACAIFGWSSRPLAQFQFAGGGIPSRLTRCLYMISVPLKATKPVLVPRGACEMEFVNKATRGLYLDRRWQDSVRAMTLDVAFKVPEQLRFAKATSMKCVFTLTHEGGNMRSSLSVYNVASKAWVRLGESGEFDVPDPGNCYDASSGSVKLKADMAPARVVTEIDALSANAWRVREFDVEMTGE